MPRRLGLTKDNGLFKGTDEYYDIAQQIFNTVHPGEGYKSTDNVVSRKYVETYDKLCKEGKVAAHTQEIIAERRKLLEAQNRTLKEEPGKTLMIALGAAHERLVAEFPKSSNMNTGLYTMKDVSLLQEKGLSFDDAKAAIMAKPYQLIDKLDRLDRQEAAMKVEVEGNKVTVRKGDDVVTTGGNNV